jgi:hypothetical protein
MLSQINKALKMEQKLKKFEKHGTNFIYISMNKIITIKTHNIIEALQHNEYK